MLRGCCLVLSMLLFAAAPLAAQGSALEGFVKGKDGKPLAGANVVMTRLDVHRSYQIKTDKKGYYYYSNLPLGFYSVTVQVEGADVTGVTGIRTQGGNPLLVNFDLQASPQEQENLVRQQLKKAGAEWSYLKIIPIAQSAPPDRPSTTASPVTPDPPARTLTPEEKAALDRQVSERAAQMKSRDDLNQSFTNGLSALQARQFPEAVALLEKAAELAPKEPAVWADLGAAYAGVAAAKSGSDFDDAMRKCFTSYARSVELAPNDASTHYSYASALARGRKLDEMWVEARKYAALDAAGAYRLYFNLGSVLTNAGQTEPAAEAFHLAVTAAPDDPKNAESYYQWAVALSAKATVAPDGKVIPAAGTAEALRKYLELSPAGPNAGAARDLLATFNSQMGVSYTDPKSKKKK